MNPTVSALCAALRRLWALLSPSTVPGVCGCWPHDPNRARGSNCNRQVAGIPGSAFDPAGIAPHPFLGAWLQSLGIANPAEVRVAASVVFGGAALVTGALRIALNRCVTGWAN